MSTPEVSSPQHGNAEDKTARLDGRSHLQSCSAHFDHLFDSFFCLISFDSLVQKAEDHCGGDTGAQDLDCLPLKSRARAKWQLRHRRYSPRVLLRTCVRLCDHARSEAKSSERKIKPAKQKKLHLNVVQDRQPSPAIGSAEALPCRTELRRRLQLKLEQLKHGRKSCGGGTRRLGETNVVPGEECSPEQERPNPAPKESAGECQPPVRKRRRQTTNGETAPVDFDFGVVTRSAQSHDALQTSRAGTKRRRLQKAIREVEAKRMELEKCQTAGQRRQLELKHSLDKARRKLCGEKVMDDMSRLKKKAKVRGKKARGGGS